MYEGLIKVKFKGRIGYILERHMTGGVKIGMEPTCPIDTDIPSSVGDVFESEQSFVTEDQYEVVSP